MKVTHHPNFLYMPSNCYPIYGSNSRVNSCFRWTLKCQKIFTGCIFFLKNTPENGYTQSTNETENLWLPIAVEATYSPQQLLRSTDTLCDPFWIEDRYQWQWRKVISEKNSPILSALPDSWTPVHTTDELDRQLLPLNFVPRRSQNWWPYNHCFTRVWWAESRFLHLRC